MTSDSSRSALLYTRVANGRRVSLAPPRESVKLVANGRRVSLAPPRESVKLVLRPCCRPGSRTVAAFAWRHLMNPLNSSRTDAAFALRAALRGRIASGRRARRTASEAGRPRMAHAPPRPAGSARTGKQLQVGLQVSRACARRLCV